MTWWQALIVLMQGATAGVPFWALLWAIDRLRGGDGTRIDSEALEAAWQGRYGAAAEPALISETPAGAGRDFVETVGSRGVLRVGECAFAVGQISMGLREPMCSEYPPGAAYGTVEIGISRPDAIPALKDAMEAQQAVDLTFSMGPSGTGFAATIRALNFHATTMRCEVEFTSCGPIVAGGTVPPMGVNP